MNVDGWLKEIEKHCGNDVSILVLGNKSDVGQKLNTGADGEEDEDEE